VLVAGAHTYGMASPLQSIQRPGGAARSAVAGTIVMAFGFFDGVFLGAPIALLAAALRPVPLYCGAVIAVILLVIGCCRWVDRRWDDWFAGKGRRIETRLEAMRASRLMRHPVAWIQRGSDRWYALAAAVANPILVAGVARFLGGKQIGERRIVLGAVAYAIPYVAMWMIVGLVVSGSLRAL
jgi:hypothetical protein